MNLPSLLFCGIALGCSLAAPGAVWAAGYAEAAVDGGGSVTGSVRFSGTLPEPEHMKINKDMEVCGGDHRMHQTVRTGDGGALADVIVFLDGISAGKSWGEAGAARSLLQKDCAFHPYLQPVPLGSELTVKNGDPVSHNIHTYELVGRARLSMFNVQQPSGSDFKKKVRMRRARVIRVECDQHDFMIGWMYAVENPYFAVVGDDGSFSLSDVPAGKHKLKAWHPYLGFQEAEVTVEPDGTARVDLEFN